jgi:hypothetical protein
VYAVETCGAVCALTVIGSDRAGPSGYESCDYVQQVAAYIGIAIAYLLARQSFLRGVRDGEVDGKFIGGEGLPLVEKICMKRMQIGERRSPSEGCRIFYPI